MGPSYEPRCAIKRACREVRQVHQSSKEGPEGYKTKPERNNGNQARVAARTHQNWPVGVDKSCRGGLSTLGSQKGVEKIEVWALN